ncbi:hypothetical protein ACTA71_002339 [Dictyostelium dimigraforme]
MKNIIILIVLLFNLNLILTQFIDGLTPKYLHMGTKIGNTIFSGRSLKIMNPIVKSSLIISSSSTNDLLISGDGFGPTAKFTLQEPLSNINHSLSCINTYPFKLMTCTIPQNNLLNNCYTINVKDDYTNTTSFTTFTKPSLNSIELIGNRFKFGLSYNCPGSNPTINLNINSQNVGSIPSNYIYSPTVNLCSYYGNSFNVSITTSFNSYSNLTSDSLLFDCRKGLVINNSSNTDENSSDSNNNCTNTSKVKDNAVKNVTVSTPSKKQNIVYSESGSSSESEAEVVSKNPFPRKRNNETFNDIGLVSFNYPVDQNDILDLTKSLPFNFYSISQLIPLPYFIVRTNQAIKVFLQIPTPWGIHFPKISLHQGKEILSNNPEVDPKDFYLCIKYHPRLPQRDQLEEFFTSEEISKLVITAKFLPMQKLPIKLGLEMDDETPNHFVHEIKNGFIVFTINSIQVSDDDF